MGEGGRTLKVILFGETGMIGSGVLLECLGDPRVEAVLTVGRSPTGRARPKLTELLHDDLFGLRGIRDRLAGHGACFFCLGVSSAGMTEADYHRITYDLTVAVAETLLALNPDLVFCYVSGAGTDSTERGRAMWARVKGKLENRLLAMTPRSHMFRPGFIQPVHGVRSKTRLYRIVYGLAAPFFPLLRRLFPNHVSTSDRLGRAMIAVAAGGDSKRILEVPDINALAAASV